MKNASSVSFKFYSLQVRNPQSNMCLDTFGHREGGDISIYNCHGQAGNQEFGFTDLNELQFEDDLCLDVPSHHLGASVIIYSCHGLGGNQRWEYSKKVCSSNTWIIL